MKSSIVCCVVLLVLASCNPDEPQIMSNQLIGAWNLTKVDFNGVNSSDVGGWNTGNFLNFKDTNKVEQAYQFGKWNLNDRQLTIEWNFEGARSYTVVTLSKETLVVEYAYRHGAPDSSFGGLLDQHFASVDVIFVKQTFTKMFTQ
jgi:hypothetical protein